MIALLLALVLPGTSAARCTSYDALAKAVEQKNGAEISRLARSPDCLRDGSKPSLLALAAEKADFETFRLLVSLGADPNLRNISDGFCRYQILHQIQQYRSGEAFPFLKLLVDAGADLQSCPEEKPGRCGEELCGLQELPLGQAAKKGDLESVNYLADRGARILGDELFYSSPDIPGITRRLLERGADPAIAQNTPLFRTRSGEAVKLLVKAGADINFRQFGYGKAIPLAIYSKPDVFLFEPILAAIEVGADLRLPMTLGASWPCAGLSALLCWAGQMSPTSLIAMVHALKYSQLIDLELRDAEGRSAAMLLSRYYMYRAGRAAKTEVLKLLISRGADLRARDKAGKSVLDYWQEYPRENRAEIPLIKAALGEP